MEKKKFKPSLKDTARRAKIIADIKEFTNSRNSANKERLDRGVDEPITIPLTPQGGHRHNSENHGVWGGLDVGIAHLPDAVQGEFIDFMVDRGHRVYDERDDISKDPKKQKLGLRAGIVHIDDNVTEENVDPAKNYVKEKGPGVHYDQEFGDSGEWSGTAGRGDSGMGYGGGYTGGGETHKPGYGAGNPNVENKPQYSSGGGGGNRGGGDRSRTKRTDWGKKYRDAEAARKKLEEEYSGFKTKVGDYETKYKRLDELESVPFTEQRSQLVRLAAQAKGLAPSQAEKSMRQSEERQLQQMLGATKMGRGGGAAKMRGLRRMAEGAAGRTAQMGGLMRMREKAMAEQALGGSVSEMTGQALKDRWTKMGLDVNKEIAKIQAEAAKYGANLRAKAASDQAHGQMVGGLLGGLGTIAGFAMFSDKKMKKKIKKEDLYKNEYGDVYPGYESEEGDSSSYGRHSLSLKERKKQSQDELDKLGFKRIKEARKKSGNKSFQAARVKPKEIETIEKKWGVWDEKGDSKIHKPVKVTPQDLLKKKTKRKKAVKYEKGEPKDFSPQKFLDALKPNSFEYKDKFKKNPLAGEGRFLGVMAQDLEKAGPVGKSMVEDTPMGKLVNYGKGFGAVLAAQAHLNQRLKALESKKKKRK